MKLHILKFANYNNKPVLGIYARNFLCFNLLKPAKISQKLH